MSSGTHLVVKAIGHYAAFGVLGVKLQVDTSSTQSYIHAASQAKHCNERTFSCVLTVTKDL